MTLLNALLVRLSDAVLAPLSGLPALAVVTGAALATALAILGVMRLTSNQPALAAVKRQIHAGLLEMRLYNDDLRALVRAQGDVLWQNLRYVGHSLVPLVVTAVPLTLLIAQMQAWYGYQGLTPGQPVAITATVDEPLDALPRLDSAALDVVGPPRHFPTRGEVVWRVVPRAAGDATITLVTNRGTVVEKTLTVGAGIARRSPVRSGGSFLDRLLYPSEDPIAAGSGITAVRVPYADRTLALAGVETSWLVFYVALSLVFVLLLRKPLGVVI